RGLLRSGIRLCGRRRTRLARGARSALARGAVHFGARPDRRTAGLRDHAGAAKVALRRRHWFQLSGAEPEGVEAFQGVGTACIAVVPAKAGTHSHRTLCYFMVLAIVAWLRRMGPRFRADDNGERGADSGEGGDDSEGYAPALVRPAISVRSAASS